MIIRTLTLILILEKGYATTTLGLRPILARKMLLAFPSIAGPREMAEGTTLPALSAQLAKDCEAGHARQGTVDLFKETFPDASINYVGCVPVSVIQKFSAATRPGVTLSCSLRQGAARSCASPNSLRSYSVGHRSALWLMIHVCRPLHQSFSSLRQLT